MLLFGHIGITAGVVRACDILVSVSRPDNSYESGSSSRFGRVIQKKRLRLHHLLSGIKGRIGSIDYRIVLLGSLLPDIIDKPLWLFVASHIAPSGRGYAHTLLFNLALFICGLILIRYRKSWLLIISVCSFMHLIFDQLWNSPVVLLWPLLGQFPSEETAGWLPNIIQALFSHPSVYIPEIIGLVIVLLLAYRLVIRRSIISFIRGGAIG